MAKRPPDPSKSLSARQLAEVLGVNRATIARAVASGRLDGWKPIQVNARLRFIPVTTPSGAEGQSETPP